MANARQYTVTTMAIVGCLALSAPAGIAGQPAEQMEGSPPQTTQGSSVAITVGA